MEGHGCMQAGVVLEKEPRVLYPYLQEVTGSKLHTRLSVAWAKENSEPTILLQQGHTYFHKATPPNSAPPFGVHFLSNSHRDQKKNLSKFKKIKFNKNLDSFWFVKNIIKKLKRQATFWKKIYATGQYKMT